MHVSNVNCLKIGKKYSRVLVTGREDQKVNMWVIGKSNAIMVYCKFCIGFFFIAKLLWQRIYVIVTCIYNVLFFSFVTAIYSAKELVEYELFYLSSALLFSKIEGFRSLSRWITLLFYYVLTFVYC